MIVFVRQTLRFPLAQTYQFVICHEHLPVD